MKIFLTELDISKTTKLDPRLEAIVPEMGAHNLKNLNKGTRSKIYDIGNNNILKIEQTFDEGYANRMVKMYESLKKINNPYIRTPLGVKIEVDDTGEKKIYSIKAVFEKKQHLNKKEINLIVSYNSKAFTKQAYNFINWVQLKFTPFVLI